MDFRRGLTSAGDLPYCVPQSPRLRKISTHTARLHNSDLLVQTDDIPPVRFVYVGQERPDDGASHMPRMKRFRDVRAGELHDDLLALTLRVRAIR